MKNTKTATPKTVVPIAQPGNDNELPVDKRDVIDDIKLAADGRVAVLENVFQLIAEQQPDLLDEEQFWYGMRVLAQGLRENVETLSALAEEGWAR